MHEPDVGKSGDAGTDTYRYRRESCQVPWIEHPKRCHPFCRPELYRRTKWHVRWNRNGASRCGLAAWRGCAGPRTTPGLAVQQSPFSNKCGWDRCVSRGWMEMVVARTAMRGALMKTWPCKGQQIRPTCLISDYSGEMNWRFRVAFLPLYSLSAFLLAGWLVGFGFCTLKATLFFFHLAVAFFPTGQAERQEESIRAAGRTSRPRKAKESASGAQHLLRRILLSQSVIAYKRKPFHSDRSSCYQFHTDPLFSSILPVALIRCRTLCIP